jgi:hypothetical protein
MTDLESRHLSMFRKGMASLIAVAVVISASPDTSCAQLSPGRLAFGPSVAWVKPVGDLGETIPAAFAIGANLDYQAHNAVGLGFDLMYYDESFTASDQMDNES